MGKTERYSRRSKNRGAAVWRKFILEHPDSGMRMKPYEGRDQLAVDRVNDITSCRQER